MPGMKCLVPEMNAIAIVFHMKFRVTNSVVILNKGFGTLEFVFNANI